MFYSPAKQRKFDVSRLFAYKKLKLTKINWFHPRQCDVTQQSSWWFRVLREGIRSATVSGQQWVSNSISSRPPLLSVSALSRQSADGAGGSERDEVTAQREQCVLFLFTPLVGRCRQMCRSCELFASCSCMSCVQANLQWEEDEWKRWSGTVLHKHTVLC